MTREAARAGLTYVAPVGLAPVAEPIVDATGRLHAPENGKFLEKPAAEPAQDTADSTAAEVPLAEGETATPTESDPGGSLPEGFVRLAVPDGDPLRDQGHEFVPVPQGMEDVFKNLLNRPVKRKELDSAREARAQLEQELDRHAAALRAANEFNAKLFSEPRIIQTYNSMAEDYGPEQANAWLKSVIDGEAQNASRYVDEASAERQERRNQQAAQQFLQDVEGVRTAFSFLDDAEFTKAMRVYASAAAAGGEDLDIEEFKRTTRKLYIDHPRVVALLDQRRAEQTAAAALKAAPAVAAEAAERADLERARSVQDNGLSILRSASGTGHAPAPPAAPKLTRDQARAAL